MIRIEDFEEGSYQGTEVPGFFLLNRKSPVIYHGEDWWLEGFFSAGKTARIEKDGVRTVVPFAEVEPGAVGL